VTVALLTAAAALAAQISEVPACVFARRSSRQVSPPPLTLVKDWEPLALGPSELMNASSSSPGPVVVSAGEEMLVAADD
jgi:hypothetical protein